MTTKFQAFDPAELEPKTPGVKDQLVSLFSREQINSIMSGSTAALDKINSIQSDLQDRTSKIDQQLKADIINNRVMSLRREAAPLIDEQMKIIHGNADLAKKQERFWVPIAVRIRATFDSDPGKDATIRLSWLARLEKTSAVVLGEVAALAAATGSLALGHCLETELDGREGKPNDCSRPQRTEIMGFVNAIPNSSKEVLTTLAEIQHMTDVAAMAASGKVNAQTLIRQGLRQAA